MRKPFPVPEEDRTLCIIFRRWKLRVEYIFSFVEVREKQQNALKKKKKSYCGVCCFI